MRKTSLLAAFASLAPVAGLDAPAFAQSPQPAAAEAECSLHVRPTSNFDAYVSGGSPYGPWRQGDVYAFAPQSRVGTRRMREILATIFTPEVQAQALDQPALAELMGWAAARIVLQPADGAQSGSTAATPAARQEPPPCAAELEVTNIIYQQAALTGLHFRVHFTLRDPGRGRTWRGNVAQRLRDYPYGLADDLTEARSVLIGAYQRSFVEFVEEDVRGLPSRD